MPKAILEDIVQKTPAEIISILQQADDAYFGGDRASDLTDDQYDALKQLAQRIDPSNVYFTGVGSKVRGEKVKLPYKMGSLDQVYEGDFSKWVVKNNLKNEDVVISDKLDGVSAMCVFSPSGELQIAYSRGDGIEGADITRHVRKLSSVPTKLQYNTNHSFVVRGEIIMRPSSFASIVDVIKSRSGQPYKNPRNMVAGLMNAETNNIMVYDMLDFVAYEIVDTLLGKTEQFDLLKYLGFAVARYNTFQAGSLTDDKLTAYLVNQRKTSVYEIDGVVIEVDSGDLRHNINPTRDTLNPAYAVKYKVADSSNYAEPIVTGVTWAISKDGYLKPTIQIEPTNLVGVTIQNCTGFNAKFIQENGIGPGARIALVRSGDVIPFCQSVLAPAPAGAQMPDRTDVKWTDTGVDLVLEDASNDETAKFERLLDFFNTIDIPHLGEGNLRPIFDAGFDMPEDVITLTQEDLCALVGSKVMGKKIFDGMREKLNGIPEYQLMGAHPAFGRGVGVRKMKKLWEHYKGELGPLHNAHLVCLVDGFDTKTADKVAAGMAAYLSFKMKVGRIVNTKPYEAPKEGKVSGKTFVFTGFRSRELEQMVETAGGKMASSVSSKTSYVVADDLNSSSGKAVKARESGIPVITVEQLREML